jgi:hypothetical protein
MISLSPERVARERRRASEHEAAHTAWSRENHRAFWQSAGLVFLGVPVYALSWYLTDPDQIGVVQAGAYCVSYVGPWVRLLAFHLRRADQG